jgi:hypothetical protein
LRSEEQHAIQIFYPGMDNCYRNEKTKTAQMIDILGQHYIADPNHHNRTADKNSIFYYAKPRCAVLFHFLSEFNVKQTVAI